MTADEMINTILERHKINKEYVENVERELLARTEKLNELMKEKQILIRKFQEILDKLGYEDYYMLEDAERDFKEIIGR